MRYSARNGSPDTPSLSPRRSFRRLNTLCLLLLTCFPEAPCKEIDWFLLAATDTLALFIHDNRVGIMHRNVTVDSAAKTIVTYQRFVISADAVAARSFSGMEIEEKRVFDFFGNQRGALQKLKSETGVAVWELSRDSSYSWRIAVTAGGITSTSPVEHAHGSLRNSYAVADGIRNKTIHEGQEWHDTLFELTSAKNMVVTTRCIALPGSEKRHYVFTATDNLAGMHERREVDGSGRVVVQEIAPVFTAVRIDAGKLVYEKGAASSNEAAALYELVHIPMERSQEKNETIAITLKSGASLHESVLPFYTHKDGKYHIKKLNSRYHTTHLSVSKEDLAVWLRPTPTIQSNHPAIHELAMNLKQARTCRGDIARTYNNYLFKNIGKRHVASFSNALETLQAGYGDCGEHAVLLAALLRTVGIESMVAYGLVYMPDKKAYFYHAWVAAFVKDLVFMDPALGVMPATSGYIPLVLDDDGTKLIYPAGLIGKIEISYEPLQ